MLQPRFGEADPINRDFAPPLALPAVSAEGSAYRDANFAGRRITGLVLAIAFHLVAIGAALMQWKTYQPHKTATVLSVFDIAPPAAPPEPAKAVPPGPEQVETPPAERDRPETPPPIVHVPTLNPMSTEVASKMPDLQPPVERTAAPEGHPTPPAAQPSNAKPTWEGLVLAALNREKRYPRDAQFSRRQGVPYIRFVMDRSGRVISARLEHSSGVRALDDEAVSLPRRAQPLPRPPEEVTGETIELVVPVEFFMR